MNPKIPKAEPLCLSLATRPLSFLSSSSFTGWYMFQRVPMLGTWALVKSSVGHIRLITG